MTLLELAQERVYLRKVGSEYHGPCPACGHGPKSTPQTSDRFTVKPDRELFFCRTCTPEGGTAVKFLMRFEGKGCSEAHALLGKPCDSTTCPAERCPARANTSAGHRPRAVRRLDPPREKTAPAFVPSVPLSPAELWLQRAEKLIGEAHAALLDNEKQLAFLAGRGLPREAVVRYRLGWLEKAVIRPRAVWGLPEKLDPETKKPKALWIPRGLLIPTFVEGVPHRLRVRRPKEELANGGIPYIEVEGSGDDRIVLNPQARAVVVVESDLDALLIDWCAGDLVGAMPTVSAQGKPRVSTWPLLQQALCILVASDFESVFNEQTQRWVSAGGTAAKWWREQFPRAKRWPVPDGKDPGEFYQCGGDVRAWIMDGLPPVFRVRAELAAQASQPAPAAEVAPVECEPAKEEPAAVYSGRVYSITTTAGHVIYGAECPEDALRLVAEHPGEAVFTSAEFDAIVAAGYGPEEFEPIYNARRLYPFDGQPLEIKPVIGSGLAPQRQTFDPSRSRRTA